MNVYTWDNVTRPSMNGYPVYSALEANLYIYLWDWAVTGPPVEDFTGVMGESGSRFRAARVIWLYRRTRLQWHSRTAKNCHCNQMVPYSVTVSRHFLP